MKRIRYSIELSADAEKDFDQSCQYYYRENPEIANTYYLSINNCFENHKYNPELYPFAFRNIRKAPVQKFPFVVYYRINDAVIQVLAIFHTSRNPIIWKSRTES